MDQRAAADKIAAGSPKSGREAPADGESSAAGWLCKAPCSWFQLLLKTLPREDKMALFQTSRKLCRQVVHSMRSTTLRLRRYKRQSYNTVAVRQQVITGLLERCVNLKIILDRESEQPFPSALSSIITELTLELEVSWHRAKQQVAMGWSAMQRLHTLVFWGTASAEDVTALCEAMESGQLPCLRSLTWWPKNSEQYMHMKCSADKSTAVAAVLQRLACAAGKQVSHLAATDELLTHVLQLTVLKAVTVLSGYGVAAETVQRLCQHPTLRHVTVSGQADDMRRWSICREPSIKGDHSHLECKWETLTLMPGSPELLAVLPSTGLKAIRFKHRLTNLQGQDAQTLESAVTRQGAKIVCVPDDVHEKGVFELGTLCKQSSLLIPYLRDVHTLHMTLEKPQDQLLLRNVYARLPPCVSCIVLQRAFPINFVLRGQLDSLKFHEECLWQHLPKAITHVKLEGFHCEDFIEQIYIMLNLVRQAPAHVRSLAFVKLRGANWGFVSDILGASAPAHLRLQFTPWS